MTRILTLAVVLTTSVFATQNAFAIWGWMQGAAIGEFTDADWEILEDRARETLNTAADGEQVNWRNEDTGDKGAMKVIMTFRYNDQTCRRIAFLNVNNQGQRGVANYNLCKQADQTWKFVSDTAVTANQN